MASRREKLKKLDEFRRRVPHVSASALSAICQDIEEHGVPEIHRKRDLHDAARMASAETTSYGPTVITKRAHGLSGTVAFLMFGPLALLSMVTSEGGGFTDLMQATMAECPPSFEHPWDMVLYSDEIVPGTLANSACCHGLASGCNTCCLT